GQLSKSHQQRARGRHVGFVSRRCGLLLLSLRKQKASIMTQWLRWSVPPAIVLSLTSSAYAVQYLTVEQAQKLAFPSANSFVAMGDGHGFRAEAGGKHLGLFVVDHVIGKHLYIDYAVALDAGGRVQRVEILQYRESYGGEVRSPSWLAQFVGKTNASA